MDPEWDERDAYALVKAAARGDLLDAHSRSDTPLGAAAYKGRARVVKYLLDKGAEVDPEDRSRRTNLPCVHGLHRWTPGNSRYAPRSWGKRCAA
jgi:ankyrin repeat protein